MGKRRKKNGSCLGTIVALPIIPFAIIINSAMHYKPTPIVGRKRGRKKKIWF